MKVVITEKPSVAREIAAVLGVTEKHDGYIANDKYAITWAFGHLLENCPPESYGWKQWTAETLPMIPNKFLTRPVHRWDKNKKEMVVDSGVQKQLSVIDSLFNDSEEIIVATDAGREGELIFRLIYNHLRSSKPFKRLWVSSLTTKAIKQAFSELKDGQEYDNLYLSAKCRSEADWLVGMNASRALTIGAAFTSRFSIGRVQTPTLGIICSRFNENKDFKPEPYYILQVTLDKQEQRFKANSESLKNKELAAVTFHSVEEAEKATIVKVEKKEKKENPPLLYDLTTLQRDANKYFGFSADNTLKLAQSLYEGQYITYPRTGSCYISEDVFQTIPELLKVAASSKIYGTIAQKLQKQTLNNKSVNGEKVTDHHALLITENFPQKLGEKEARIYSLILIRMLEAFSEPCLKDSTQIELVCGGVTFKASGSIIKEGKEGWREVKRIGRIAETPDGNTEAENEEQQTFPELIPHETVNKLYAEILTRSTKPKPIHTEASLLLAMETCGKDIEDEASKEAMKDLGIGTPATRAGIIETLLLRNYIERNKKKLIPTGKGLAVYSLLKEKSIASAELTGRWENRLEQISRGKESNKTFMDDISKFTTQITKDLLLLGGTLKDIDMDNRISNHSISCPKCKTGEIRKGAKNYYCSNYPKKQEDGNYGEGCRFTIWPVVAGKTLTESNIRQIAEKGKTALIKGFKSKAGKLFNAYLSLKEDGTLGFEFESKK